MSDDDGRPHLRIVSSSPPDPANGDGPPAPPPPADPTPPPAVPAPFPPGAWSALHDLTGQVAMLIGTGDGLDLAIASALGDAGARLAVAQRDAERARLVARQVSSGAATGPGPGHGNLAMGIDPSRAEQVRAGIAAVEQVTGRLDALVVIIDIGPTRPSAGTAPAPGVSLGEMVPVVRATARRMAVRGGGRIVVVAGGAARDPDVGAVTTGAVAGFVDAVATKYAGAGVTVNAVLVDQGRGPASGARPRERETTGAAAPDGSAPGGAPAGGAPGVSEPPPAEADPGAPIPFPAPASAPTPGELSVAPPALAGVPDTELTTTVAATLLLLNPAAMALHGHVLRVAAGRPLASG